MDGERLITLDEVAERMRVSVPTVRRWIKAGKLPATKPSGVYRVRGRAFEEFVEKHTGKAQAPPSPESEVSEERRFVVRGWTLIFEDLAARYEKVEEKLRAAQVEDFPEIVVDIGVLASYNFRLLSREAEEVQSAPGVFQAAEKVRSKQARLERLIEQTFGPLSAAHAAQLDRFRAANAAASLTSGASMQEAEDERRGIS